MPAPDDLENLGYGRGYLRPGPAASVRRIDVALGRPLDINSAYRDYDEQMRAYLAYRLYQRGLGPWAPLALHPDDSWHCKGLAIDTDDRLGQLFLDNGWRFEVSTEPWHGQYYTSLDKNYGSGAGGGSVPFPTPEDDMYTDADRARDVDTQNRVVANGQLLTEVRQILYDAGLAQNSADTALIKKSIFDKADGTTDHWDGLDAKLTQVLQKLE